MKTFLVLIAIIVALVVAGWLTIGRSDGKPAVILETNQIQQDTEKATEKGKELLDEATQKVDDLRKDRDAETDPAGSTSEPEPDDIHRAAGPTEPHQDAARY